MLAHAGIIIDFQLRVLYFRYSSEYDIQVVDKVIVPRNIPESDAKERLQNVKDSDFLEVRVVTLTLENTRRSIKTVRCVGV
jgi:hypothetical protein